MKHPAVFVIVLTVLALARDVEPVNGQSASWRTYWAPDKSFSVDLPTPLVKCTSFEGEHGASFEKDQTMSGGKCFAGIETTPEDSRFGILVIDANLKQFKLRGQKRVELLEYLGAFLIGDDDENSFMKPAVTFKSNNMTGNEYLYIKDDKLNRIQLYTRGRILDTGKRIFVIVFVGKNEVDLKSSDASRFFESFRVH